MPSASIRRDLKAVRNLINQADRVLATIPQPHHSVGGARESLTAALALTRDIIQRSTAAPVDESAAAALGAKGGNATLASKGPEYFKRISAMRKKKAGGRPRKER
jgi:hypothetical protein